MMQWNGQEDHSQQQQQQQQQQHHQYQGSANQPYSQPDPLGLQVPAGTGGSFMAGLQNDPTVGRYPANYSHRTNDAAVQLQSFDNAALNTADFMQPNLGSGAIWPPRQNTSQGFGSSSTAADTPNLGQGFPPSEPSSSTSSFPNFESLGPGGLASFSQRRLHGPSDQAKPPPMQLHLSTSDDVAPQQSALGSGQQQYPNSASFDSPCTASTTDSMAHHLPSQHQYSLPASPLHLRRESWTEGARPAERSTSPMQQISGMPSLGPQSDYSGQISNLSALPQLGQGSSSLSRDEGSWNSQLTESRRNSSMSLADSYVTSDDKRAQEILKLLRSRAPDSKEGVAACDYCRKRRIKCDREKPTCGRCAVAGRLCTTSDTLRKRGPPSKKEREFLAAQGIQFVPSRIRRRSAALEKAEDYAIASVAESSANQQQQSFLASSSIFDFDQGNDSANTSSLTSPELSPKNSRQNIMQSPLDRQNTLRRQRSDTVPGMFSPRQRQGAQHSQGPSRVQSPRKSRSFMDADVQNLDTMAANVDWPLDSVQENSNSGQSDKAAQDRGQVSSSGNGNEDAMENSSGASKKRAMHAVQDRRMSQDIPKTALVLNQFGALEGMDPGRFPASVTQLARESRKGEAYWASMNMSSADVTSILKFSERLLRHEVSKYLLLAYFKNYHNRFPFAYEPWIWQALETVQREGEGARGEQSSLHAGTQALLLSLIAMSSCTAQPWNVNDGQPVNLWWFGYAAHQASMAIVDPPYLHAKGATTWTRYTDSFLSPDLAQSFILIGGYLMNDSPKAVWRIIQLGWDICLRQGFLDSRADPIQRGSMINLTASEICKEQGIRTVWALMKLSVTIYLTGRITTWPRFLVEFSADLPSALQNTQDGQNQEAHLNPESLEAWSSAMPINRLLLQILTSPLSAEWSQHQASPCTVPLDEKRRLVHGFRMEIARWKQDANCLKSHRAMPLTRTGDEDLSWVSVSFKARVILRIAEERLAEAQQSMIAEADQQGLTISEEERRSIDCHQSASRSSEQSPGGPPLDARHGHATLQDRVSAWFQTVEDENVAWYCGAGMR
ncbi:unnamed protein product [Sympodiomycopsis kandeliae]